MKEENFYKFRKYFYTFTIPKWTYFWNTDLMKSGSVLINPQFVTSTDNRELRAAPVITDNGLDNDKKLSY